MNYEYDFVAIGDITIDNFIKLKDATVNCEINRDNCMLCVRFGDKIPYERAIEVSAVGNSPNASVSAARLGLRSALISNLGSDENGEKCFHSLTKNGVETKFVEEHKEIPTNYHFVLQYEEERTILIKHHDYPYKLPQLPNIKWMYLSSLGEKSLPYHEEIVRYLRTHKETKLAFQPGTFQIKLGYEKLKDLYEVTELFFCNKEEAQRILKNSEKDIKNLLRSMHKLGPKIVVITDGPNGAYTYDGEEMWHMPMYPDIKSPVDRTGAGDAFSSTLTSFLAMDMSIPEALRRAPINSMSVVQYIGAQEGLLSKEKLEKYLENAPVDYKAVKIS